jgi:hypothetical protein
MIGAVAALSLSSGPIVGVVVQVLMLLFSLSLPHLAGRWVVLVATTVPTYLFFQLFSSRPIYEKVIYLASLDPMSYWARVLIWEHATQSVQDNILFGTPEGQWQRPEWMPPSIDHYWLLQAVNFGLPAALLLVAAVVLVILSLVNAGKLGDEANRYRNALTITILSICIVACTVALWGQAQLLFFMLLGAGAWLAEESRSSAPTQESKREGALARQRTRVWHSAGPMQRLGS